MHRINTSQGGVLVAGKPAPGLAVHGYDTVALFAENKPVLGMANHAMVHDGATYRFASQAHLDTFKANPAKYEPACGGFCVYGVSVGAKFDGDPRFSRVVDGKLYLNLDADIAAAFSKDVPGTIAKAQVNWPGLKEKSA